MAAGQALLASRGFGTLSFSIEPCQRKTFRKRSLRLQYLFFCESQNRARGLSPREKENPQAECLIIHSLDKRSSNQRANRSYARYLDVYPLIIGFLARSRHGCLSERLVNQSTLNQN
jgi:hypothetical protein